MKTRFQLRLYLLGLTCSVFLLGLLPVRCYAASSSGFVCVGVVRVGGGTSVSHVNNQKENQKNSRKSYLSLIALGAVPTRNFESSSKKSDQRRSVNKSSRRSKRSESKLLSPVTGTVPPSVLYYQTGANLKAITGKMSTYAKVKVGFNRGATVVEIPPGKALTLMLRATEKERKEVPYLKIPAQNHGVQLLGLMMLGEQPNPTRASVIKPTSKSSWKSPPQIKMLNLNSKAMMGKNLLVWNFCNRVVSVSPDHKKPINLSPGQRKSYQIRNSAKYHPFIARTQHQALPVLKTSTKLPDRTLTLIVFYNAHPKTNAGKPVGVFRAIIKKVDIPPHRVESK